MFPLLLLPFLSLAVRSPPPLRARANKEEQRRSRSLNPRRRGQRRRRSFRHRIRSRSCRVGIRRCRGRESFGACAEGGERGRGGWSRFVRLWEGARWGGVEWVEVSCPRESEGGGGELGSFERRRVVYCFPAGSCARGDMLSAGQSGHLLLCINPHQPLKPAQEPQLTAPPRTQDHLRHQLGRRRILHRHFRLHRGSVDCSANGERHPLADWGGGECE